jgi:hypothetical protein
LTHRSFTSAPPPASGYRDGLLVRYHARNVLAVANWGTDGWWLREDLQNSGIEIMCGLLALRVLKAQAGDPPHPGQSRARQLFWQQADAPAQATQLPLLIALEGFIPINGSNLIVDWQVADNAQILLALSKPVGSWPYQGRPRLAWRRHVLLSSAEEPSFMPPDEDVFVEPEYEADNPDHADGHLL